MGEALRKLLDDAVPLRVSSQRRKQRSTVERCVASMGASVRGLMPDA